MTGSCFLDYYCTRNRRLARCTPAVAKACRRYFSRLASMLFYSDPWGDSEATVPRSGCPRAIEETSTPSYFTRFNRYTTNSWQDAQLSPC
eukprot:scaffold158_cov105-Cylindrotheca_fusiformis.AAC.18